MTATDADRTTLRCLAFAWCAAICLLALLVAAPGSSLAQIGGQTGYQEWVPPQPDDRATDGRSGEAPGGGDGAAAGGGGVEAASGGGAGSAGEGPGAAPGTQPAGVEANGEEGSVVANRGGQPSTGGLSAQPSEEAAGTIPLTRDNILLALVVAAAAIGAGFGVNRVARRFAGT